ncbi:MAG: hypothetical protein ABEK59_01575 [Halobacteria archaeon]
MRLDNSGGVQRLPGLDVGVNLVDVEGTSVGPVQSLTLNQMLLDEGGAVWVDANDNARTSHFTKIAPSMRFLDRIRVARGFTAFQHLSTVRDAEPELCGDTAVLVLPDVDYLYTEDNLREGEGREMLESTLKTVRGYSRKYEVPVLVTRRYGYPDVVSSYTDRVIECRMTEMGPRFSSGEFETLVYAGDRYVQTTLALWRRILEKQYVDVKGVEPEAGPREAPTVI